MPATRPTTSINIKQQESECSVKPEHSKDATRMDDATTILKARVPARRLQRAEKILQRLGLTSTDAVNLLLAQIELRKGLPFEVALNPSPLRTADEQAAEWTEAFGAY